MNIDEIKELIRVVNESGVAELEVQRGENRVRIRRSMVGSSQEILLPTPLPVSIGTTPTASFQPALPASSTEAPAKLNAVATPVEDENSVPVKSPIVGTYYDAPSPGAPSFVKVGDRVEPRQVLCIIESMKLMNEIEAEIAGTVAAKLVENGRPVEYGQTLFTIRPH
ncbi:MAG TPA: acetyl-CoA carboxylase biotin carboxyl carrier protein [Bryobacteraceae bacterium]|nr:acetyl-CoA carboxylase biotin carboxyl carrier protein [Bryobacteraceae bacterium]